MNPLLKTNGKRGKSFNFVFFVVWSALTVSRWLVVVWDGKSCFGLAEISSLVFLVLFKDETQGESSVSSLGGLRSKRCCDHKEAYYNATKLRWEISLQCVLQETATLVKKRYWNLKSIGHFYGIVLSLNWTLFSETLYLDDFSPCGVLPLSLLTYLLMTLKVNTRHKPSM